MTMMVYQRMQLQPAGLVGLLVLLSSLAAAKTGAGGGAKPLRVIPLAVDSWDHGHELPDLVEGRLFGKLIFLRSTAVHVRIGMLCVRIRTCSTSRLSPLRHSSTGTCTHQPPPSCHKLTAAALAPLGQGREH